MDISEFTAIDDDAAAVLSKHEGDLDLDGLPSLSDPGDPLISTGTTGGGKVRLTNLETLSLTSPRITGAGLVHLKGPTNLQQLDLDVCTRITDA